MEEKGLVEEISSSLGIFLLNTTGLRARVHAFKFAICTRE